MKLGQNHHSHDSDEIQISVKLPNSWDRVYFRQQIQVICIYTRHIYIYIFIHIIYTHIPYMCIYIKDTDIHIQYVDPLTSGFPYPLAHVSHQGLAWGECLHGLLGLLRRGSGVIALRNEVTQKSQVPKTEESWHNPYPWQLKKRWGWWYLHFWYLEMCGDEIYITSLKLRTKASEQSRVRSDDFHSLGAKLSVFTTSPGE